MNTIASILEGRLSPDQTVKLKTLGYKKDGNTVCRHFVKGYQLNRVIGISDLNLYIAVFTDPYNDGLYKIYNKIDDNLFIEAFKFLGTDDFQRLITAISQYVPYSGKEGFIRYMKRSCITDTYIYNTQIIGLQMLGYNDLMRQVISVKEKRMKKIEEKRKEKEKKEQQRTELLKKEHLNAVQLVKDDLSNRREVKDKSDIILELLDQYHISVPIRTRGWIKECLASIYFDETGAVGYTYYKRHGGKGSHKMLELLQSLMEKID